MLSSPANTAAWSTTSCSEAGPHAPLVTHRSLASPGERLIPEGTGFGDPRPQEGLAPIVGRGKCFLGEKQVSWGGSSCKVGTIPVLHSRDGLRPPRRQAGQGGKASDLVPLTTPEESREKLFLWKEWGCFPLETEALVKSRGQKM